MIIPTYCLNPMPNEHPYTIAKETGVQFGENMYDVYDVFTFCDFCLHLRSLQVGTADCINCIYDHCVFT